MDKILTITISAFSILFSACSVITPKHYIDHDKKMEKVSEFLEFSGDYKPKYFTSPAKYINILNNNSFHVEPEIFTTDNSPYTVKPVKIAWDSCLGKNEDGKEVEPDYAVIMLPGSAGSYIKFTEYIYDLEKAADQKIAFFMMDNRGQGFSTWFNPKTEPGFNGLYVDKFENYIKDLKFFYDTVVKPKITKMEVKYGKSIPCFIYGQSLGGGIAARYLELYPDDFDGAVLSSPAIKILHQINRSLLFIGIQEIILHGGGAEYLYPMTNVHEQLSFTSIFCNTSSEKRWQYWQKISNPDYYKDKDLVHPNSGAEVIRMGYPTFWWAYQVMKGTNPISKSENAKNVKVPFLILCAEKDDFISLKAVKQFLQNTPEGLGKMVLFADSMHDIALERDSIREKSIELILNFLNTVKKNED